MLTSFFWVLLLFSRVSNAAESSLDPLYGISQIFDLFLDRAGDSTQICNGRLTLTSGTPVTTSDVTAATTVYFTPYHGNQIALYSGTAWQMISFSEDSVTVPSTTSTPFDVFAYNNGGTLDLEVVDWTNDTTRATALTTQNGVYVKNGATTRRYLGTGRTTTTSGKTEDSVTKRFLWNNCNRVTKPVRVAPSVASWSYATGAWRASGNDTAFRIHVVAGRNESSLSIRYFITDYSSAAACNRQYGITLDGTGAATSRLGYNSNDNSNYTQAVAEYSDFLGEGGHYVQAVEYAYTCTFQIPNNLTFMAGDFQC